MYSTRSSSSVACIEASLSSASVNQNAKDQQEKRIRSSVTIRARFLIYFALERVGLVIDVCSISEVLVKEY